MSDLACKNSAKSEREKRHWCLYVASFFGSLARLQRWRDRLLNCKMTTIPSRLLAVLLLATTCLCGSLFADQKFDSLRKAAEQGDAWAQNNLGLAYNTGRGVAKDQVESVKWWRKAAEQGDARGQGMLGFAYASGEGVAKDQVEGYAWTNLAAVTNEAAKERRAQIEKTMTAQQVAEGQKRATELSALIKKK